MHGCVRRLRCALARWLLPKRLGWAEAGLEPVSVPVPASGQQEEEKAVLQPPSKLKLEWVHSQRQEQDQPVFSSNP